MSVITLLEKAQRINNAMPARMAQRPQVSETVIPEKEFITVKQAKEKFKIPIFTISIPASIAVFKIQSSS